MNQIFLQYNLANFQAYPFGAIIAKHVLTLYHAGYFHVLHSFPNLILLTCNFPRRAKNSVNPDQLASKKEPADQDLHSFKRGPCKLSITKVKPCNPEYFYVLRSSPIFIKSTCQIPLINMSLQAAPKTVWILISWLLRRSKLISIYTVFKRGSCKLSMTKVQPCNAEYFYVLHSSPIFIKSTCQIPVISVSFTSSTKNSVDSDQLAS